jgi:hypothetical protein
LLPQADSPMPVPAVQEIAAKSAARDAAAPSNQAH